jgi:hypothetical protein
MTKCSFPILSPLPNLKNAGKVLNQAHYHCFSKSEPNLTEIPLKRGKNLKMNSQTSLAVGLCYVTAGQERPRFHIKLYFQFLALNRIFPGMNLTYINVEMFVLYFHNKTGRNYWQSSAIFWFSVLFLLPERLYDPTNMATGRSVCARKAVGYCGAISGTGFCVTWPLSWQPG